MSEIQILRVYTVLYITELSIPKAGSCISKIYRLSYIIVCINMLHWFGLADRKLL